MKAKQPLYRKVNTKARGVRHDFGGDFKHERRTKDMRGSMHAGKQRGLDYTPLFRFLLSKVETDWDEVHSEAVGRLDREEPIFWLVARGELDRQDVVRLGESSYYSGLYVDEENRLQKVAPELRLEDMQPACTCCTHTFNGERFG